MSQSQPSSPAVIIKSAKRSSGNTLTTPQLVQYLRGLHRAGALTDEQLRLTLVSLIRTAKDTSLEVILAAVDEANAKHHIDPSLPDGLVEAYQRAAGVRVPEAETFEW